jgi:hypothetical protein
MRKNKMVSAATYKDLEKHFTDNSEKIMKEGREKRADYVQIVNSLGFFSEIYLSKKDYEKRQKEINSGEYIGGTYFFKQIIK